MKCAICREGIARPGFTTVTLTRGETTVVVKGVPADVCENCGEYYLEDAVAERVLERAERAAANGAEVEILRYAA
jgi:YgiT-type zinc finger domain-containing protein